MRVNMRRFTFSKVRQWSLAILIGSLGFASCDDEKINPDNSSTFELVRDDFQGEIADGEVVLESGTYKLTGKVIVKEGATLTIKPGVRIEASTISANRKEIRYIAVAQGGKINVQGTASNPVIMTADTKKPGSWGGLVICGRAPINKVSKDNPTQKTETASAEVSDLTYGGSIANDNSGSIKYLRIEYSGYSYNSEKEFNALSFFAVGNGTTVEYVQSYEGSDDAFEWFGGTVNAKYLVALNVDEENVGDDIFDWTEGWNGTGENWYGKRSNLGNRGIEADNNSDNYKSDPVSNPTIKNLTLIGAGTGGPEPQAIKMRVGTNGSFDNVVLSNWNVGFDIQHDESLAFVEAGQLKATNVKFDNVVTKSKGSSTANTAVDITKVFTENNEATGAGNGVDAP